MTRASSPPLVPPEGDSLAVTEAYSALRAARPEGRVTLADIEAHIAVVHYLNGGEAVLDTGMDPTAPEGRLTLALLTLGNGFVVVGKSAPMDPANFDPDKGKRFAYEDAVRQIWPLMAYSRLDHPPHASPLRDDDPVHPDEEDEDDPASLREPETGD